MTEKRCINLIRDFFILGKENAHTRKNFYNHLINHIGGSSTSGDISNDASADNTPCDAGSTENTGDDIGGTGAIDLIDFSFNDVLDMVGGIDLFQPMNFDPATGLLIPSPGVTLSATEVRVD